MHLHALSKLVDETFGSSISEGERPAHQWQAPGGICGLLLRDELAYFPFGRIDGQMAPPTPETIFAVGSIAKVLTTSIMGLFVAQGHIGPNEAVVPYLPAGYQLPESFSETTFLELASFGAGVPDQPPQGNLATQADFASFLREMKLPRRGKGGKSRYSDSSIGLLAHILMSMDGFGSFGAQETGAWWREHLFNPLGMEYTGPPGDWLAQAKCAEGFSFAEDRGVFVPVPYVGWSPWGAAGRAFSSCADLLRLVRACVGHRNIDGAVVPVQLSEGLRLTQTPVSAARWPGAQQGWGWIVWASETDAPYVGKAGGVPGASAYIAASPTHEAGVVLLTNRKGLGRQMEAHAHTLITALCT